MMLRRILNRNSALLVIAVTAFLGPAASVSADTVAALCTLDDTSAPGCEAIRARELAAVKVFPFSAVGRVDLSDGANHCTGTLVSHRTVLTAAHCLWQDDTQRMAATQTVTFTLNPAADPTRVTAIILPNGTAVPADPAHDIALLTLATPLGAPDNHIPLFRGKLRAAGKGTAALAGFAALRPDHLTVARDCHRPLAVSGQLMASCSAMPGDSGAPLLWWGQDGLGSTGVFLLGVTTAIGTTKSAFNVRFAPWFRLRDAIEHEILLGN